MPEQVITQLFEVIKSRKGAPAEESYTASLFAKGDNQILKKIGEELTELIMAAALKDEQNTIYECADVFYHMLVLLAHRDIELESVFAELERRTGKSGLVEKRERKK